MKEVFHDGILSLFYDDYEYSILYWRSKRLTAQYKIMHTTA